MIRAFLIIVGLAAFIFGMRAERYIATARCDDEGGRWSEQSQVCVVPDLQVIE